MIRSAQVSDAAQLCTIYNHYVRSTSISFEEADVSPDEMGHRIEEGSRLLPWYVFEKNGAVLGYSYATPWKVRSAYRYSVESSVYVSVDHGKQGIGSALYQRLVDDLRERGVHIVLGGIALPNQASIALHQRMGFVQVAQLREVGRKFDRWVDVGYWQLMLSSAD